MDYDPFHFPEHREYRRYHRLYRRCYQCRRHPYLQIHLHQGACNLNHLAQSHRQYQRPTYRCLITVHQHRRVHRHRYR